MSIYIPYVIGSAGLMLGNYLYNYIYEDNKLVIESTPSLTPNSFYPLPLNKVIDIEEKYDILKSIEIL